MPADSTELYGMVVDKDLVASDFYLSESYAAGCGG